FAMTDEELAIRAFLHNPRVMISNAPGWVVWRRHSAQLSHNMNARLVASRLCGHRKLIALIENAADRDLLPLFCQRCITEGRRFYLNGFRREAIELMSIAWNTGYNGPLLENICTKCFGMTATLSARNFLGELKRGLRKRILGP